MSCLEHKRRATVSVERERIWNFHFYFQSLVFHLCKAWSWLNSFHFPLAHCANLFGAACLHELYSMSIKNAYGQVENAGGFRHRSSQVQQVRRSSSLYGFTLFSHSRMHCTNNANLFGFRKQMLSGVSNWECKAFFASNWLTFAYDILSAELEKILISFVSSLRTHIISCRVFSYIIYLFSARRLPYDVWKIVFLRPIKLLIAGNNNNLYRVKFGLT